MINALRKIAFLFALLVLAAGLGASPAFAKTHHKKHHVAHKHGKAKTSLSETRRIKTAQQHLISLGYLSGKADGIAGPKTKIALEHFQRDHMLPITGKLTTATYNALVEMDMEKGPAVSGSSATGTNVGGTPPQPDFYATHPDFYGHVNQQYAEPMLNSTAANGDNGPTTARTQTLPNRFAKLDVAENVQGTFKSYAVTMNGQPLLQTQDQPAVIGISRTYDLGDEDAIIFSTYRNFDPLCSYKTYLLTLGKGTSNVQEINNCTRGYQASVKDGSLWITFPEYDDKRAVGNTWRYEKGSLQKL